MSVGFYDSDQQVVPRLQIPQSASDEAGAFSFQGADHDGADAGGGITQGSTPERPGDRDAATAPATAPATPTPRPAFGRPISLDEGAPAVVGGGQEIYRKWLAARHCFAPDGAGSRADATQPSFVASSQPPPSS